LSYSIKQNPTTVLNPQSNGIKERMHLTMAEMLRTMTFEVANESKETWRTEVDVALQSVAWALRSTVNSVTKYAPVNLAFGRDMVLNEEVRINWTAIKNHRESQAIKDNTRENKKRKEFVYEIGKKCWIVKNRIDKRRKLDQPTEGPYAIVGIYNNGTVKINRNGYDETINIRRLKPFIE